MISKMIDSPIFFSLVLSNSLLYETPKGQQSIKNTSGTLVWSYNITIVWLSLFKSIQIYIHYVLCTLLSDWSAIKNWIDFYSLMQSGKLNFKVDFSGIAILSYKLFSSIPTYSWSYKTFPCNLPIVTQQCIHSLQWCGV